jgi:hypothetical protein
LSSFNESSQSLTKKKFLCRIQDDLKIVEPQCLQEVKQHLWQVCQEELATHTLLFHRQDPDRTRTPEAPDARGVRDDAQVHDDDDESLKECAFTDLQRSLLDPDAYLDFGFKVICR